MNKSKRELIFQNPCSTTFYNEVVGEETVDKENDAKKATIYIYSIK